MTSWEGFQQHFSIISKSVCCGFCMKKNIVFTLISFTVLKRCYCLSVQLPFELPVQIPVQLLLELEPNLLVKMWLTIYNVNETTRYQFVISKSFWLCKVSQFRILNFHESFSQSYCFEKKKPLTIVKKRKLLWNHALSSSMHYSSHTIF